MNILFNINSRWKPDIYDNLQFFGNGPVHLKPGTFNSNSNDIHFQRATLAKLYGGAGFFGEVRGPCGWKENKKKDCCFKKCKPLWKTRLWPFNISI